MGAQTGWVELPLDEAVELAHALTAHIAEKHGMRALFIKGPIANLQGLRPKRLSTDVDVFVDPSRVRDLINLLTERGWHVRPTPDVGKVFAPHAIGLIHDEWPCDIDVHDRYPGFFAEPTVIFETLWQDHTEMTLAHKLIPCPNVATNALVSAVHALRDPRRSRNAAELTFLIDRLNATLTTSDLRMIAKSLATLRAQESLASFAQAIGLPPLERDLSPAERRAWNLRISDESSLLGWYYRIMSAHWRSRPKLVIQALFPDNEYFRTLDPKLSEDRPNLTTLRYRRLLRAVRGTLPSIRRYRQVRRSAPKKSRTR